MLPKGNYFLNSKQKKKLLETLNNQFGIKELIAGVYVQNAKEKIYLINQEVQNVDLNALYIDAIGLYIGAWQKDGFRLSIDAAQLFFKQIEKNIIELTKEQRTLWLKGQDIPWEKMNNEFVIVIFQNDILGCGKFRINSSGQSEMLNYTPKARRLVVINE